MNGGGTYIDYHSVPCCILGHAGLLDSGVPEKPSKELEEGTAKVTTALVNALSPMGEWLFAGDVNDEALVAINRRKGLSHSKRVSFAEWCEELHVVRGE